MQRETMNIVIVGHVDHGKSTLVGRLLADTGVLGEGKLEKVQETCRRQGKLFEYAFLLDALEAEQDQGITIDAARVFFRTDRRDYIIIDAPGHIEFLKNMVTGAARAEAAVLLIDANEGVRENSRRHGYLLSMLGIRQVVVAVNKMDLVGYDRGVFERIVTEYREFLHEVGIDPMRFIPISAREGDLITTSSDNMVWYEGPSTLQAVDAFEKQPASADLPLRVPVQDVYKFNVRGDDLRIVAGRVEAGTLKIGDEVLFSPSNKSAKVATIEEFAAAPPQSIEAGGSVGVTLDQQLFIDRGEIMSHTSTPPGVSTRMRVNLFWLGREPMVPEKTYTLKLATASTDVNIHAIHRVLDASDLGTSATKQLVERHDVADVVLATRRPVAFDAAADVESTGRFVIVDGYDIAGGGIVRELVPDAEQDLRVQHRIRNRDWSRGDVTAAARAELNGHPAAMVMFTGDAGVGKAAIARALEKKLVHGGHHAYLLDGKNVFLGVDADIGLDDRSELVRRFGEVAHLFLDAGLMVVSTTNVIGLADHRAIETMIAPFEMFIVHVGESDAGDLRFDANCAVDPAVAKILETLQARGWLR